jgi:hypothetical protein
MKTTRSQYFALLHVLRAGGERSVICCLRFHWQFRRQAHVSHDGVCVKDYAAVRCDAVLSGR